MIRPIKHLLSRTSLPLLAVSLLVSSLAAPLQAQANTCHALFASVREESRNGEALSEKEIKLANKIQREAGVYFRQNLRLPEDDAASQLARVLDGDLTVVSPVTIRDIVKNQPQIAELARNRVVNAFVTLAKYYGRTPAESELSKALDLKPEELKAILGPESLFLNFEGIKKAAVEKKPRAFEKVVDTTIFTKERHDRLIKAVSERQRLIVTTAVAGSPINMEFFATLVRAAREMDAEILIFPANMQTSGLDPILLDTPGVHIITNAIELTPWLALNNIKITAKQINPLMGLDRFGPRGQTQIVGSPKLHVRTVPTVENDLNPHFLMTTGAVTEPIYNGQRYIQERTNALAAEDHVLGALILEKSQGAIQTSLPGNPSLEGFFHFRHIEYVKKAKGFTDLNRFYTADGVKSTEVSAITLPDSHVGVSDPHFVHSLAAAIRKLKPKRIALHDLFNGHSVNHHDRRNLINGARNFKDGKLDLEQELRSVVTFLNSLLALDPKLELRIVDSNHNSWLHRWLNEGQYMNETHNRILGHELAGVMLNGKDPLAYALEKFGLETPKRVVILKPGSWKESGVEMAQHGHSGANGAKGSLQSFARAADRMVYGHSHTTQRSKHTVNVGTGTVLRQDYNADGPSSWSHSFAAISPHGEIQVFVLRHGEWWAQEPVKTGDKFFARDYPVVKPNNDTSVGQQVDQYSGGR